MVDDGRVKIYLYVFHERWLIAYNMIVLSNMFKTTYGF